MIGIALAAPICGLIATTQIQLLVPALELLPKALEQFRSEMAKETPNLDRISSELHEEFQDHVREQRAEFRKRLDQDK